MELVSQEARVHARESPERAVVADLVKAFVNLLRGCFPVWADTPPYRAADWRNGAPQKR